MRSAGDPFQEQGRQRVKLAQATEPRFCTEGRSGMPRRQGPAVRAAFDGMKRARSSLRRHSSLAVLTVVLMLLVSCGGEPRLALPANPSSTPATAVQAAPIVVASPSAGKPTIGEIIWTTGIDPLTDEPVDVVSHFSADAPRLVAATKATAMPPGSPVEATWSYNDTPLEPFTTQLSTGEVSGEQWLSFYLDRDPNTPWPAGLYEVTVMLDGAPMQESAVEVVDAQ
jgi:hypothetical protein